MTSNLETYKKRSGTLDHGKEFEYLMCAFYSLKLIDCEKISDFEIFTNHAACEDFDDVVLTLKFFDGSVKIILLQLKHSENNARSLKLDSLTAEKGDFSLIKYQKSYSKINKDDFKSTFNKNKFDFYVVLYTNRSAAFGTNSKLILRTEECQIKENETDVIQNLLNTNEEGNGVFKIETTTENSLVNFRKFFEDFYIYTNQKNHQNIKNAIHEMLLKKFSDDIANAFVDFFKKWWEGNFVFTKKDVIIKLSEMMFSPSIKTLSHKKRSENSKLLKEAIMLFDVTIVEGCVDGDIDEKIWNEILHEHFHKLTVVKTIEKFALTDRNISTNTQLNPKEIIKSLWYLDKVPFVIEINKSNKNQIQSAILFLEQYGIKKKLLLKGDCEKINLPNGWKVLKNLFDVKKEKEKLYQNIIEQFEVGFENEETISLENLFANDEENSKFLDLSGLLYILSGRDFPCIKRKKENLPLEYVPRAVTSVFLDSEKLLNESVLRENLFIINCNNKIDFITSILHENNINLMGLSTYLEMKDSKPSIEETVIIAENEECTLQQYRKICSRTNGNVHLLKITNEKCFMLIASHGNRKELKQFASSKSLTIEETNIHRFFDGPLNFISAEPGMGKSTTMKYLKNEAPSDYWTIFIELKKYNSKFKGEVVAEDILKTFLNSEKGITESFSYKIKQIFVKKRKVIFFLDGLDEMEHDCVDNALKCIKEISLQGFRVWVSTRENFQEKVEEQLNIFPVQIVELNKPQQEEYIKIRLKGNYENDEIEKIVEKISNSVNISNNNKFLGIPLQLYIITEILINNRPANLEFDEKMFVLTNLYEAFFKGIIKHDLKKNGLAEGDLVERILMSELDKYTIPALKICLMDDHFQRFNLNLRQSDEFLLLIKEKGDTYGIIKQIDSNGEAVYGHQTYVEYFACYFLSRNFDKVQCIKQELFNDNYTNLRLFLDLELAKESPLHLGIIYGNVEFIKKCIENSQINKDKGSRSPLHLICSYVNKYQRLTKPTYVCYDYYEEPCSFAKQENFLLQRIVMKLVELCPITEKDELYQWNPVEYASVSGCLFPIEAMLQKRNEILNFVLETLDEATLLYYATRLTYPNLLRAILKRNPSLIKEIEYGYVYFGKPIPGKTFSEELISRMSILHVAIKENVKNIQILEILLSFVNNLNTLQLPFGKTIFHFAAKYGNIEVMKLLHKKSDLNHCNENEKETILHKASVKGDCELISYLFNYYKINPNIKNADGQTALYIAALNGNYNVVKFLIEKGAKVDCITKKGKSVLHAACKRGNYELISYLLNYNIDLKQKDIHGRTALYIAARRGNNNNNLVKLLIEKGAGIDCITNDGRSVLHAACGFQGNCELITYLLNYDIDLNLKDIHGRTALYFASSNGHTDVVKCLIEKGAKVDCITKEGENVLHVACRFGANCELISYLVNCGIDLNQKNIHGRTALYIAALNRNNNVVKFLIKKGAKVDCITNDGKSLLHAACGNYRTNYELISYLLNYDIDLNQKDIHGRTALYSALHNGNAYMVKCLIERGAKVDCITSEGESVLHAACRFLANCELISYLLNYDIDLNQKDIHGRTALYFASYNGYNDVVKCLIEKGAKVDCITNYGESVLHAACGTDWGNYELISYLLNYNIDLNLKDSDGYTALSYAERLNKNDVVELLIQKGADVNDNDTMHNKETVSHQ